MSSLIPIYPMAQSSYNLKSLDLNKNLMHNSSNDCALAISQNAHNVIPILATIFIALTGISCGLKTRSISFFNKYKPKVNTVISQGINSIQKNINSPSAKNKLLEQETKIIKKAQSILQQENGILQKGKKEYTEAMALLKKIQDQHFGNLINTKGKNKIIFSDFGDNVQKVMEEYKDDKIVRRTIFDPIQETISSIEKTYNLSKDGTQTAEEVFEYFLGNNLSVYKKGFKETSNGNKVACEVFNFTNNRISEFKKGYENFKNGTKKAIELFKFKNSHLSEYFRDFKKLFSGKQDAKMFYRIN